MSSVVELKVGLHCEECIKKILKAIKKIEDIETYNVDTQLNKVTVTGKVTREEVIKALQKIGKTASNWEGEVQAPELPYWHYIPLVIPITTEQITGRRSLEENISSYTAHLSYVN